MTSRTAEQLLINFLHGSKHFADMWNERKTKGNRTSSHNSQIKIHLQLKTVGHSAEDYHINCADAHCFSTGNQQSYPLSLDTQ